MSRHYRHLQMCTLLCLMIAGLSPSHSTEAYSENIPYRATQERDNSQQYVSRHRNDLNKIYRYADTLRKEGHLVEVLQVYTAALTHHPQNPVLVRKRILAESDLRENQLLLTTEKSQSETVGSSVSYALDQIKCRTLRGSEGISACQRLQGSDSKQQIETSKLSQGKPDQEYSRHEYSSDKDTHLPPLRSSLRGIDLGNFHALVIGNNRYRHFPQLETAVEDAKTVSALLKKQYGYRVSHLKNANRYEIFQELSRLRRELKNDDNLLIYYAGHGYLDEDTKRGYWLPVDAESDNYANWLSTSDITDMLNGMAAKHVLVVADSCYSGTLTRGVQISSQLLEPDQLEWIQRINTKKSRTVMTSGGLEPVLDSGSGKHSIFAEAFIRSLEENKSITEASKMFTSIRRSVILKADQTPEYADIRKAGHEGGDFIFVRSGYH